MANQTEVLEFLSKKEGAGNPTEIAKELQSAEATIVTYLSRLKKKGLVDGGGRDWYITDPGKEALERQKKVVITKEDVGEDELDRFIYFGQLSAVDPDKITACVELFQNCASMRSMDEMERVLAEMNVPQTQRTQWKNLYRGFLRNTTPPEEREKLYPLPRLVEERVTVEGERRGEELNYIVEGNDVLKVGEGLGMFTFKEALQVVSAKRGTYPQAGQQGQPLDADGIIKIVSAVKEWTGDKGTPPKSYVVTQGEGGAVVQEMEQGKPVVLNAPVSNPPAATYFVDGEGNVRQAQPGEPIVITQKPQAAPPSKAFIVRQTAEGMVAEEHDLSKPLIINAPAGQSSGFPGMVPFPVFSTDGKPVYDSEGKPVYADIEPMMKMMGFQSEQKRADERHSMLMGLGQTVRENFGDGIQALKDAVSEVKGEGKGKKAAEQPTVYECSDCHTQFGIPNVDFVTVKCPKCSREYTKEEVMGA